MESNGPDVRIRGTAAHIAEKYQQLARDAQSAGDIVAAESYWQHAEHYNRMIAAAQAAQEQQREERRLQQQAQEEQDGQPSGDGDAPRGRHNNRRRGPRHEAEETVVEADGEESSAKNGSGPQPDLEEAPAEIAVKRPRRAAKEVEEGAEPKPRTRRPRKPAKEVEPPVAEAAAELPAFISGGAEE